jgi:transcriptional regulator with XRE-family HTH domain
MARAALELGVRDLARIADVSPNTIARLERGEILHTRTLAYIRGALEAEGVRFIDARAVSAWGGVGIRLGAEGLKSNMGELIETIRTMPDLHNQPATAYVDLLDALDRYLSIIEEENRQPDAWERLGLDGAVNALKRSAIFDAKASLWHAITPPDNQSPDYPISTDLVASTKVLDLSYFRRRSKALRERGYTKD